MNLGKSNLEVFSETLLQIAKIDPQVMVVTSDSRGSARLSHFCEELPERVVEVGVAEQNLVGVAAGLAAAGKKVFAVSPASFLTARALEQIKNDVAYSDQPVKLVGISAGVSYGALGSTHHSLHDLAVLQAIHNIDLVVPADNFETRETIRAAVDHPRPLYIRFGKRPMFDLHPESTKFEIGRAIPLASGRDVVFIACGETVSRAVMAADLLMEQGISSGVLSLHSLRPFDEQTVLDSARKVKAVITVEEHSIYGGLGSRVASLLLQAGVRVRFRIMGIPDEYTIPGSQEEIFSHYHLTPTGLAETARQLLE